MFCSVEMSMICQVKSLEFPTHRAMFCVTQEHNKIKHFLKVTAKENMKQAF